MLWEKIAQGCVVQCKGGNGDSVLQLSTDVRVAPFLEGTLQTQQGEGVRRAHTCRRTVLSGEDRAKAQNVQRLGRR